MAGKVWLQKVCQKCGAGNEAKLTVDHIHQRSHGGSKKLKNLQLLCALCHRNKSKLFDIMANEKGRNLTEEESITLNLIFKKDEYCYAKVLGVKRAILYAEVEL